jgi:integrase
LSLLRKVFLFAAKAQRHEVDLRLKTSRDSFATTLKRSGKSRDEIGEMMGHSTAQVTDHFLASLDMNKTWEINKGMMEM